MLSPEKTFRSSQHCPVLLCCIYRKRRIRHGTGRVSSAYRAV